MHHVHPNNYCGLSRGPTVKGVREEEVISQKSVQTIKKEGTSLCQQQL